MGGIFLTGAVFAVCFGTGFFCFRLTETKREEYLKKMEAELADIAVTDLKNVPEPAAAGGAQLVTAASRWRTTIFSASAPRSGICSAEKCTAIPGSAPMRAGWRSSA